ncbi:extracellular solute-binding protein [Paenibacillus prosopidis]|uniref:Iron(III) transport system substrate-binding protein n=1 Tax=Paenibacillus prosopidis TaxID=630520 RepID=A0A368W3B8_9BACL|nr:extracellular solute-binding protein [Paenibacillus prosopidis]RCW49164.1 iron(III) transport system substrate-binding protein [Paenibacillus prosopidis]
MKGFKNRLILTSLIVLILGVLSACGGNSASNAGSSGETPAADKEAAASNQDSGNTQPANSTADKKKVVVYTNAGGQGRAEWVQQEAAKKGIDVQFVNAGGGDLANRLIAEKNNPVADVIWGLTSIDYEKFKKQDMLEKYVPAWAEQVDSGLNDSGDYYHATAKQAILMMYDKNVYTKDTAPTDWPDLWNNSQYQGKYAILTSGGATMRSVLAGILMRYQDPNGEYGISKQGWDELTKFYQNGRQLKQGEDLFETLSKKEQPISPVWSSGIADFEQKFNIQMDIVSPKVGVPHLVESVALVKGAKNADAAKQFIDWFGTAEVQGPFAAKFSYFPANKDALKDAPQKVKDIASAVTVQEIDWKFVSDHIDQWVQKIELQIMK